MIAAARTGTLRAQTQRPGGVPHQPGSGFEAARRAGLSWDYVRLFRILRAVSRLRFETLLGRRGSRG